MNGSSSRFLLAPEMVSRDLTFNEKTFSAKFVFVRWIILGAHLSRRQSKSNGHLYVPLDVCNQR